jgi:UrcA family protein
MSRQILARTSVMLALGLLSAAAMAGNRPASPSDGAPRVVVHYDDLDLTSEQGALTLYQRISGAAKEVCPSARGPGLLPMQLRRACIASAIERAVSDVNSPTLATVVAARGKRFAQI